MLLVPALPSRAQAADPWLVVPGKSVGAITAKTTPADLVRIFGARALKDERIGPGADAEEMLATVVNGSRPDSSLSIFWDKLDKQGQHPAPNAHPDFINLCYGSSPGPDTCKWRLSNGISFGTSLRDSERINGKSFKLYDFGWDYSGAVSDWNKGTMESGPKGCGRVGVSFEPHRRDLETSSGTAKFYQQLLGDQEHSSNETAMQQLNPVVRSITVSFDKPGNCPSGQG